MIDVSIDPRRVFSRRNQRFFAEGAVVFAVLATVVPALARSRGVPGGGCEGCHGSPENSVLSVSPTVVTPGERTTLRFTLSDQEARVGGMFIEVDDTRQLSPSGNMAVVSGGLSHTRATNFSGGEVSFSVVWDVPDSAGATRFAVSGLAGNGDGRSGGDEGSFAVFDFVYGCDAQTFYPDYDGDGYGRDQGSLTQCAGAPPSGYAAEANDCNDNNEAIYPGAIEYCNRKDDDCDEVIDEEAQPVELYPDADGDGFYSSAERTSGEMVMGCLPYEGYADTPGDCDSERADVNPDGEEVCDLYSDEDCDGRVDERVRPICGVGWCRRESPSCDIEHCTPGQPVEERCNFLDDDCDGDVDEGDDLCPAGELCLAGECRAEADLELTGSGEEGVTAGESASPGQAADDSREDAGCHWSRRSAGGWWGLLCGLGGLLVGARRRRVRALR